MLDIMSVCGRRTHFFCKLQFLLCAYKMSLLLLASSWTRLLSKCSIPQNLIFNCGCILLSTALDAYVVVVVGFKLNKVAVKIQHPSEPHLQLRLYSFGHSAGCIRSAGTLWLPVQSGTWQRDGHQSGTSAVTEVAQPFQEWAPQGQGHEKGAEGKLVMDIIFQWLFFFLSCFWGFLLTFKVFEETKNVDKFWCSSGLNKVQTQSKHRKKKRKKRALELSNCCIELHIIVTASFNSDQYKNVGCL